MIRRLAIGWLERAFGTGRAQAILGDLEEDLTLGHGPSWASWLPGTWIFWQVVTYVTAHRWAAFRADRYDSRSRLLEFTTMWHDVRYAVRRLRSTPTFTLVALLVLAPTIGVSTAIFSVVDAVVLRSLPYAEPDRLVQVGTIDRTTGSFGAYQPPQNFADWQASQSVFAAMTATQPAGGFTIDDGGGPRDLLALQVTAGYFDVYQAHPQLGRPFTARDAVKDGPRVALISDGLWRQQFGADPQVIGATLRSTAESTYGAPFPVAAGIWTIVGVMPAGFRWPVSGPGQTDVWVPYVVPDDQRTREGSRSAALTVTARLAEGVEAEDADAQIRAITASLADAYPAWFEETRGGVRSLHEATIGDVRAGMLLLLSAAGVVLLIACVNIANLMLARGTARSREIRTSLALGASRWRIARGLIIESLVLAIAGMLLGLVVALWGVDLLRAALPNALPRIATVALDLRVLGVSTVVSLLAGLLFGVAPALLLSGPGASAARRDGSRSATAGGSRLRSLLVVSQMALAVVLTIGAGLFLSSFVRVVNVDLGLDPHNVLTMKVWPKFDRTQPGWAEPIVERTVTVIPEILDRIEAIPGVVSAGLIAADLPFTGYSSSADVTLPDREQPFGNENQVQVRHVTPGYAAAVGSRVVRGRYIEASDGRGSAPVVVLNEEAVARYFGDREPLGAAIAIGRGYAPHATVVGIVNNVRLGGPERGVRPEAYLPLAQGRVLGGALAVRTAGEPLAVADAVREAIRASMPEISRPEATTLEALLGDLLARRRFNMMIVALFGGLALMIACAGLYGVMAYLVTQRTREIGVRLALGARPLQVLSAMVARGLMLTAAGVSVGSVIAWQMAFLLEAFLFEIQSRDLVVYAAAAGLLAVSAMVAVFVPARRAARVSPVIALRAE